MFTKNTNLKTEQLVRILKTKRNEMKKPVKHRKAKIVLITLFGLFLAFLCIPAPRFDKPYSTVLTARDGELLGAKIADDGQWRFSGADGA